MAQSSKSAASGTGKRSLIVAVLAGGESRRMGRDKALVEYEGVPLIIRVCAAASATGLPVAVIGRTLEQLPAELRASVLAFPDVQPGLGPLGGLSTAFERLPDTDSIFLCACDLPLLSAEAFQWLVEEESVSSAADEMQNVNGAIPTWEGRQEPLFAIYNRNCADVVKRQLDTGRHSMRDLIAAGNFRHVPLPGKFCFAAADVDTPADIDGLSSS